MKKLAAILCLTVLATGAFAQGLVKFVNNANTLISFQPTGGPSGATAPGPGYYYALLTAPLGTTDPLAFTFAGIYATNTTITTGGRLQGGALLGVTVNGWAAGTSRSFEVAAWDATSGATWNPAWLSDPNHSGVLAWGLSGIGAGFAGGTDSNGASIPAMAVFGAAPSLTSGFTIVPTPEPGTMALAGLGAAALLIFRRRK